MLSAFAGQLRCSTKGTNAFFPVDGFSECFGNVAAFHLLKDLFKNKQKQTQNRNMLDKHPEKERHEVRYGTNQPSPTPSRNVSHHSNGEGWTDKLGSQALLTEGKTVNGH